MADPLLPPGFSDLERFVADWCLDSEPERYAKRLASTMDEIQEFYDAIMPRTASRSNLPISMSSSSSACASGSPATGRRSPVAR